MILKVFKGGMGDTKGVYCCMSDVATTIFVATGNQFNIAVRSTFYKKFFPELLILKEDFLSYVKA